MAHERADTGPAAREPSDATVHDDGLAAPVVRQIDPDGARLLVVMWHTRAPAQRVTNSIRARIEGSLLGEVCSPSDEPDEPPLRAVRLVAYEAPSADIVWALHRFGLHRAPTSGASWMRTVARLRTLAIEEGQPTFCERTPEVCLEISIDHDPRLDALDQALRGGPADEPWGHRPGAMAAAVARILATQDCPGRSPLEILEPLVNDRDPTHALWIAPRTFLALCDAVALFAARELGARVQWAVCEPEDDGVRPPPTARVESTSGRSRIVPLGLLVLRACAMPIPVDEPRVTLRDLARSWFPA
ncbi:MAG: hypothetical protein NZ898_16290 [Myxococcota bacterium]|nr:hypothetical protein [Myxococcota bacterium]MDW8361479.1 hypothetical protein [Myxococcales bacterium]